MGEKKNQSESMEEKKKKEIATEDTENTEVKFNV